MSHLLVDAEGFVLKVKILSAKIMDYEGIKMLLGRAEERFPYLSHLWLDAGSTAERTRAQTGCRRAWVGAWISSSARESPPRKRCSDGLR